MSQVAVLTGQHRKMQELLHQQRLALLAGDIAQALASLEQLREMQRSHIAVEEAELILRLPASARWAAHVYLAEHRKLDAMLDGLIAELTSQPAELHDGGTILALLDMQMPFKHVLEHHFEREEKGLLRETCESVDPCGAERS